MHKIIINAYQNFFKDSYRNRNKVIMDFISNVKLEVKSYNTCTYYVYINLYIIYVYSST